MASLLKGTAYVTGAGRGIGQFTAYALAKHGIQRLAITDKEPSFLKDTVEHLKATAPKVEVLPIECNVVDEASVIKSVKDTVSTFGSLDVAVNNAGFGGPAKGTHEVEKSEWEDLMRVNLTGVWLCQREQIRQMLKQENKGPRLGRGVIINVASMLGLVASSPTTPATAYTSSKHGVMGLTRTDAIYYAGQGIRINAMCPGYVETPLLEMAIATGIMQGEVNKTPMKRMAKPEEIADAITFLASPMSSFMCGAGLVIDGGYTIA